MDIYDIQFIDNTADEGQEARRQVEAIIAAKDTALLDQKNIIEHFWRLLGVGTSTEAFQKINALTALLEMVRECRHLGDFKLREQINTALALYDEATKGATS